VRVSLETRLSPRLNLFFCAVVFYIESTLYSTYSEVHRSGIKRKSVKPKPYDSLRVQVLIVIVNDKKPGLGLLVI
jgi:hypothetical protein